MVIHERELSEGEQNAVLDAADLHRRSTTGYRRPNPEGIGFRIIEWLDGGPMKTIVSVVLTVWVGVPLVILGLLVMGRLMDWGMGVLGLR